MVSMILMDPSNLMQLQASHSFPEGSGRRGVLTYGAHEELPCKTIDDCRNYEIPLHKVFEIYPWLVYYVLLLLEIRRSNHKARQGLRLKSVSWIWQVFIDVVSQDTVDFFLI